MSTAMVEMNPDYSRQMYEPQPYSHRPPDPPVQTSGLVSDSDLQHKERQEKMKHEMLNDYNEHMRKPSDGYYNDNPVHDQQQKELQKPVYYRADPPEHGLPLGQYAQARKVLDEQRHREYNMYMHEKEEEANRKRQEMRRSPDHYKPPTRQSGEMYDHNAVSQRLSDDRRREYNDRLRRMEDLKRHPPRKTPTPPGGLPVGSYEEQRKLLQAQRTQEYRDSLLKQANEQWVRQAKEMHLDTSPVHEGHLQTERPLVGSPRDVIIDYKKMKQELGEKRKFDYNQYLNQKENESYKRSPPTPPVGLDIATEEERIRIAQLRKQQYGDELRRQQRDQIINRAQNQIMPVIDRRNQSPRREPNQAPPPVPPLNEIKRPPPSGRWDPDSYRQPNYAPVQSGEKPDSRGRPSSRDLPLARSQIKPKSQEQRTYSQDDPKLDSDLSLRLASPSHQANIGHEDLNAYRKKMERELRKSDYEAFLAKQQELEETRQQQRNAERTKPAAPVVKGHYYSSDTYDKRREELFKEQQRDYQDYLRKPASSPTPGLPLSQERYNKTKKWLEIQRNQEYNAFLKNKSKSESTGRLATPSHLVGLPLSQITYDTMRKQAERERNRDYNEMLSKKRDPHKPLPSKGNPDKERLRPRGISVRYEFQDQYTDPSNTGNGPSKSEYEGVIENHDRSKVRVQQTRSGKIGPQKGSSDSRHFRDGKPRDYGPKSEMKSQFVYEPAVPENPSSSRSHYRMSDFNYEDPPAWVNMSPEFSKPKPIYPGSTIGNLLMGDRVRYPEHSPKHRFVRGYRRMYHKPKQDYDPHGKMQRGSNAPNYYGSSIGSILTGEQVGYPTSANKRFLDEKRRAYNEDLKPKLATEAYKKREEEKHKMQTYGIDLDSVTIIPQGEYTAKRRELENEWRKGFREFAKKKNDDLLRELAKREEMYNKHLNESMETPPIIPTGEYINKKRELQERWKEECKNHFEREPQPSDRDKDVWKSDERVRTIPHSGEYRIRKEKYKTELRKEMREHLDKQPSPREREREKDKGTGQFGAVLFDGEYEAKFGQKFRDERSKELQEYLEKQAIEEPPRKPYNPNSSENRIGFMSSLGTSLNKQREQLAHQRHDEYNNFLKEKFYKDDKYAIHGKPWGRPTWVDRQDVPESWYRPARERGDSHRGDRPASHQYDDRANSVRRVPQTPSYQDMLDQKRRQEASYRRDDYQDYSRPGDRY